LWQHRVSAVAAAAWPRRRKPIEVAVELRITHYGERQSIDMDNLIKPIQDALQGIAYVDDRQVRDVTGNWRDIDGRYPLRYISPHLSAAFSDGREFVHVRLWLARDDGEFS
jgi:crossover junction endodeoxyribonuclease RusA